MRYSQSKSLEIQGLDVEIYKQYREKFLEEARTLASLNHNSIVKILDVFDENNTSYIVMPYLEGFTLQKIVENNGRLDYHLSVNYIAQLAEAVDYLHKRNILHRDIKPDNMIVTPDNMVILIDFGSAREFINDATQRHTSILTQGYAPPEQYSSTGRKGSYTDIYSLGATFYFAITGSKPFDVGQRYSEKLPSPRELFPDITPEADRTIMKAMQLTPAERHQTIQEFMADLLGQQTKRGHIAQEEEQKNQQTEYNSFAQRANIEMVFVQGGTFIMGCTAEQGNDYNNDEKPACQVMLSSFNIGKYPVTQAQWIAVMGNNPSHFKGNNLPVEKVSWNDVQQFIFNLNAQTGMQYRLPTEAEWEYAARGGNRSNSFKYSGSNNAGNVAWYNANSESKTHPVGKKSPNELDIYDMSGNVWEWCNDWYGAYNNNAQTNPKGTFSGSDRVVRGGSWYRNQGRVRVSHRGCGSPNDRSSRIGFRLACS